MEETHHPVQTTTPNTAQDPLPPPPPHHKNSKRKPSDVDFRNSAYFKILSLLQQFRPHFIEILQTPDYRNCEGAYQIRKKMKLMMDLYKLMQIEENPIGKFENMSVCQPLSDTKKPEKEHLDVVGQGGTQLEHLQPKQVPEKSAGEELPLCSLSSGEKLENGRPRGSYIVGGSVFGWNFITFANRNPAVYYGVTKESYRLKSSEY